MYCLIPNYSDWFYVKCPCLWISSCIRHCKYVWYNNNNNNKCSSYQLTVSEEWNRMFIDSPVAPPATNTLVYQVPCASAVPPNTAGMTVYYPQPEHYILPAPGQLPPTHLPPHLTPQVRIKSDCYGSVLLEAFNLFNWEWAQNWSSTWKSINQCAAN